MPQQAVDFFVAQWKAKHREHGFVPQVIMAETANRKAFNAIRNGRTRERAELVDYYVVSIISWTQIYKDN